MPRVPLGVALLLVLSTAACRDSAQPESRVITQIEIGRPRIGLNDTVTLRAIATNHGTKTLELGIACGNGLDFEAALPTGERRFLLRHLPNLCDLKDSNILEPGETDTVSVVWRFADPPGTYRIRAGVTTIRGLGAPSPFRSLVVE